MASSPAYAKHPQHEIEVRPHSGSVRVELGGQIIAESARCLAVRESRHDEVVYVPREDVKLEHLESTAHETFCPFKGTASYWTIRAGDREAENAVWSYEDPYDEVAELKDCMAFYTDRVEVHS